MYFRTLLLLVLSLASVLGLPARSDEGNSGKRLAHGNHAKDVVSGVLEGPGNWHIIPVATRHDYSIKVAVTIKVRVPDGVIYTPGGTYGTAKLRASNGAPTGASSVGKRVSLTPGKITLRTGSPKVWDPEEAIYRGETVYLQIWGYEGVEYSFIATVKKTDKKAPRIVQPLARDLRSRGRTVRFFVYDIGIVDRVSVKRNRGKNYERLYQRKRNEVTQKSIRVRYRFRGKRKRIERIMVKMTDASGNTSFRDLAFRRPWKKTQGIRMTRPGGLQTR